MLQGCTEQSCFGSCGWQLLKTGWPAASMGRAWPTFATMASLQHCGRTTPTACGELYKPLQPLSNPQTLRRALMGLKVRHGHTLAASLPRHNCCSFASSSASFVRVPNTPPPRVVPGLQVHGSAPGGRLLPSLVQGAPPVARVPSGLKSANLHDPFMLDAVLHITSGRVSFLC